MLAHVGQDNAAAVGYHRVAGEGRGVEPVHRGQGLEELLGVGVSGQSADQEKAGQDTQRAHHRLATLTLSNRGPGGVDAGTRLVPALGPVFPGTVLSHALG